MSWAVRGLCRLAAACVLAHRVGMFPRVWTCLIHGAWVPLSCLLAGAACG